MEKNEKNELLDNVIVAPDNYQSFGLTKDEMDFAIELLKLNKENYPREVIKNQAIEKTYEEKFLDTLLVKSMINGYTEKDLEGWEDVSE